MHHPESPSGRAQLDHPPAPFRILRRWTGPLASIVLATSAVAAPIPITATGDSSDSSYSLTGQPYLQDFDSLPSDGNFDWVDGTTLPGWYAKPATGELDTTGRTLDPASNARDLTLSSVGQPGGADRALTYHTRVDTAPTHLGLGFANQSGTPLTSFTLAFDAEQWKEGTDNRTVTISVSYRIAAVEADLNSAEGWTALPDLSVDTLNGSAALVTPLAVGPVESEVPDGSGIWFRWTTSNSATSSTSSHDTLAIDNVSVAFGAAATPALPSFTRHPAEQIAAVGDTATFSVEVSGHPAPTLQWLHGATELDGETADTLVLDDVRLDQAGEYRCVATNSEGSATSDPATLTVSETPLPPVITSGPEDADGDAGSELTLDVTATGSAPLAYAWTKNGEPLPGNDGPQLILSPLTAGSAGTYIVTVSNSAGSVMSDPATVTVHLPPFVETSPLGGSFPGGADVSLSVGAGGKAPLSYVWFRNGTEIPGATAATLELTDVGAADAGDYHVTVTNTLGSATTSPVSVVVEVPPLITVQPVPQTALVGGSASFSVEAAGPGPITFQWFRGETELTGKTGPTLELVGVTEADEASYSVRVSNGFGNVVSHAAGLDVTEGLPARSFNLEGFGAATTGGGVIPETDPGYVKVATPLEFVTALADKSGGIRVIEILADLDLGYHEVGEAVREFGIFREHSTPRLHPVLIASGVSRIDIAEKSGLTIFSANGAVIRHGSLNIKRCDNIIIRNLKFDELWEWDEDSKGDYDGNDWDFITLGDSGTVHDVWIDHCTFTKAYDGICDIKGGSHDITFSWCVYAGDDGATNPNSFVRSQIAALEAERGSRPMYDFLRSNGFGMEDIVTIVQGPSKGHLIGANTLNSDNNDHRVTFHHQWYRNPWDRLPRLRAGNVHNYNIYVDCETARQAKTMRDARVAAMSPSNASKLGNSGQYNFNIFLNGSISTEDGAVLVERSYYKDCLTPLRNNQTDPSDPVFTGKILGIDCITRMTDDAGNSTTVRGDSTDPGNPMGPFQATPKPFSWNLPGGELPYTAEMDDPAELPRILAAGAGAGRLVWEKQNWLMTSYAGIGPSIVGELDPVTVPAGGTATFSVGVAGDPPFTYVWRKNGEILPEATSPTLVISGADAEDAGTYRVTVSNDTGSAGSEAELTIAATGDDPLFGYALGTDPQTGRAVMPVFSRPGNVPTLSFHRLRDDVIYQVESSGGLDTWEVIATNPGVTGGLVEVPHPAGAGDPRRFLRLRLIRP